MIDTEEFTLKVLTKSKIASSSLKANIAIILVASFSFVSVTAICEEMDIPVSQQFTLFMKIMTFDKRLREFQGSEVVLGILYQSGYITSQNTHNELLSVFNESNSVKFENKQLRVVSIDLSSISNLSQAVAEKNVQIIYVAPLRAYNIEDIIAVSRSKSVVSLTGVPRYVESGLAVGISNKGGKPQILINLKAAKAEGANFGAQLLKLARVIE